MNPEPDFFIEFSFPVFISLVCMLCLLIAAAFMSAFEIAFFSLNTQDWSKIDNANKTNRALHRLREKPELLLASILISNTLISTAFIITGIYFWASFIKFNLLGSWGSFLIQGLGFAFFLLLFTEVLPRIYATHEHIQYTLKTAIAFVIIQKIFKPISTIVVKSSNLVNKKLLRYSQPALSMDEISHALKLSTNESDEDTEILEGIVNFSSTDVNKIMTSRLDMVDIEIKTNYKKVLEIIIESGYSRIPVYQEDKDNIKGILYIKDLLPHLQMGENYHWQSHIRSVYFIPETKKIVDLLEDFQKKKIHIAIVVDEFGGTSGMVTMEDILEEIVGEISDEYDDEDSLYKRIDENTYIFEAKIMLNDFFRIKGIQDDEFEKLAYDIETLAGLILELKGEIPKTNEHIIYKHFDFEILKANSRRIEKIKLHINHQIEK